MHACMYVCMCMCIYIYVYIYIYIFVITIIIIYIITIINIISIVIIKLLLLLLYYKYVYIYIYNVVIIVILIHLFISLVSFFNVLLSCCFGISWYVRFPVDGKITFRLAQLAAMQRCSSSSTRQMSSVKACSDCSEGHVPLLRPRGRNLTGLSDSLPGLHQYRLVRKPFYSFYHDI